MEAEQVKDGSDMSFDSSSNSSKSSKQAQVDELTLRMGTDDVKKLVPRTFPVHLVSTLLPQIAKTIEVSVCVRFLGLKAVEPLIYLQPVYELLAMHVTYSLAQSANIFASRNVSKNQLVAANIYFAHYFLVSLIWSALAFIVYFALLQRYFSDSLTGVYLLLRGAVGSFTNIFSRSLTPFLKSESRYFVVLVRDVIEQLMFISFLVNCYLNSSSLGLSLTNAGVAYIIANGVITVWMWILIFKYNFLDVEYRGVLKFQFKRLSPIRPKIIAQIVGNALPALLTNATDSILMLEAVLFVKYLVYQDDYQTIQYVRLLIFTRVKALLQAFHLAFRDLFQQIAGYNMGIKKVTRVFETLLWTLIYQYCITIPLCIIGIFTAKYLTRAILPVPEAEKTAFFSYALDESDEASMAGAWCMLLPMPYYLAVSFMQLESKALFSGLIQLPMLIFGCCYMYYTLYEVSDNAPLHLIIALSEVINAIIGYGFLSFYIVKYAKLHKLNKTRKEINENDQVVAAAANDEIRQSVMAELAKTAEQEEEDRKAKDRQSVTNLFNKNVALRSSRQFMSLRESIGAGGDNRHSETSGQTRQSTIRVSQLNRDSIMK